MSIFFIVVGTLFILVGAIGMIRMPDLFLRMSASTKSTILGSGFVLIGVIIFFGDLGVTGRALAIFAFILATAPVSAHMIGRAAYSDGVKLWEGTVVDDLKGKYEDSKLVLSSGEFGEGSDTWQTGENGPSSDGLAANEPPTEEDTKPFIDDHGV